MINDYPQPGAARVSPTLLVLLAVLVVVLIGTLGYYVWQTNTGTTEQTETSTISRQDTITSDADLQAASTELDKADLNAVDKDLTSNDTDSSGF